MFELKKFVSITYSRYISPHPNHLEEILSLLSQQIHIFHITQLTFTCSKSKLEILEQGVKYVQKLTTKTPERCQSRCSGVFIVNFEHISHLVLVFLLLTLNM